MWTDHPAAVVAAYRADAEDWRTLFDDLMYSIGKRFRRPEARQRVRGFVGGLLAPLPRKNCWTIAEHAGDASPHGMQDLLARVKWDDAAVRADVREFVSRQLGDSEAVLIVDETGDLKKGRHTVGVQRQYSGTAGKIENCQLSVHLVYATTAGHAMVDTALFLPKSWCDDTARRAAADTPEQVRFATKPQLASRMIASAVAGGLPCRWVAGDEAYGPDPHLAAALRDLGLGYVLAVACSHQVRTGLGVQRADRLAADLPDTAWQRVSAGAGAKGHRYSDYPPPLVIVVGDAAGIRKMAARLLPLTQGGVRPRVIGMLVAVPPSDWKGSLLNPADAASFAEEASKAAGPFPVPVGVDIKGAAGYQISQATGIEAGQTKPTAVGIVASDRTVAHASTDVATDHELRELIDTLQ